jgi:hypothetical protein
MIALGTLAAVLAAPLQGAAPQHFTVTAVFAPPPKAGGHAAIEVRFSGRDPEIRINEEPAPRLKLDPTQTVLVDKQAPALSSAPGFDPDKVRYLDLAWPVSFPVALAPGAPRGTQTVKGAVTYFYCSKREGWCRKGTTDIEVPVTVP